MRVKESSDDYRYFPEPDLPPLHLDPAWLEALRTALPELPAARRARYVGELGLSPYDAAVLANDEAMNRAFEAIRAAGPGLPAKEVANLVTGDYGRALKETAARTPEGLAGRADAASLAHVLGEVLAGRLSRPNAKEVVAEHIASGAPAAEIVAARGLAQISDTGALERLVDEVVVANPAALADYRAGKAQAVGFLVGQVMKASRGQANAALVGATLRQRLGPRIRARRRRRRPCRPRLCTRPRPVAALPGSEGAGRERVALSGLAGRAGIGRGREDGRLGRHGDAAPRGPDVGRGRRHRRGPGRRRVRPRRRLTTLRFGRSRRRYRRALDPTAPQAVELPRQFASLS
jgi:hypothetical protein